MVSYGKVYLVGSGPGHEKLITVKGLEALSKADVIVYDRLVNPDLLRHAKERCELIFCGKSPGAHTMDQEAINATLVAKAKQGKRVVRLKGGDPCIFGRAGEEAAHCKQHGVTFEIVPGITSGIAAAAYAGIPLTHRELNSSVAFVTGHKKAGDTAEDFDWKQLATSVETLVFYMGVGNAAKIQAELLRYGRSPATPAAVIRWGTLSNQTTLTTTLDQLAEDIVTKGIKSPAIIVVGEIVSLRQELTWFEEQPYRHQRFYFPSLGVSRLTRTSLTPMADELEDQGATVRILEFDTEIHPSGALEAAPLLLTSEGIHIEDHWNAQALFLLLRLKCIDIREIKARFTAGDTRTAEVLAARGLQAPVGSRSSASSETVLHLGLRSAYNLARITPMMPSCRTAEFGEEDWLMLEAPDQVHALAGWIAGLDSAPQLMALTTETAEAVRAHGLQVRIWQESEVALSVDRTQIHA